MKIKWLVSSIVVLLIGAPAIAQHTVVYERPDFFWDAPVKIKDTTLIYLCYDKRDSVINADTLRNFDNVKYISLFKRYTDYAHKYKEKDGTEKPLPISKIIYRYDKLSRARWMVVDYATNKMAELTELPQQVTKTDSVVVEDPITGKTAISRIYRYHAHKMSEY